MFLSRLSDFCSSRLEMIERRSRSWFSRSSDDRLDQPNTKKLIDREQQTDEAIDLFIINCLSIRQLKSLLDESRVPIRGCLEKSDLVDKLVFVCQESNDEPSPMADRSDENLCRVCLDRPINCVVLDCGHLCCCTMCAIRLSECPLCRSFIQRIVRVYKN